MSTYADTSFLFSLYVADANTTAALAFRPTISGPLPLTAFHRVELRNALSLAVFRQRIAPSTAHQAWTHIETDLHDGALLLEPVDWLAALRAAETLAAQHSPALGSRSLDVLHVALAQQLAAKDFATFDSRQAALAYQVGLSVKP